MLDVRAVAVDSEDAAGLLAAYFDELRERFGFEPPPPSALREDAARGVVLVGFADGIAVACGSVRRLDARTAEVKRMSVARSARGRGYGRQMLAALEAAARAMGCCRMVLDTAAPLEEAARLYLRAGYDEIARYNDNPYAARWFSKDLTVSGAGGR